MPRSRRSRLQSRCSRRRLRRELLDQRAADQPGADQRRSRWCAATGRSSSAPRAAPRVASRSLDHDRDVALRRALRDRAHVDAGIAPARRTPWRRRRACRPCRRRPPPGCCSRWLTSTLWIWPSRSSRLERVADDALGQRRFRPRHRKADRMFGAALRDQDHGDAVLAQRREQPLGGAGHADHAGALDVDRAPRDRWW